ncbi:MAG: hypothetical protein AB1511_00100 [Deinococcota bacterium]
MQAELAVRDSQNNAATGTLAPRSALVGTLTAQLTGREAITVTWQALDAEGHVYPIHDTWTPQP